jgi:hypothetical protein
MQPPFWNPNRFQVHPPPFASAGIFLVAERTLSLVLANRVGEGELNSI